MQSAKNEKKKLKLIISIKSVLRLHIISMDSQINKQQDFIHKCVKILLSGTYYTYLQSDLKYIKYNMI